MIIAYILLGIAVIAIFILLARGPRIIYKDPSAESIKDAELRLRNLENEYYLKKVANEKELAED